MELEVRQLIRIDRRDTPANPSHDGDRHRVADRLVARTVGAFLGGFALPGDQRMPIWKTLQAFALEWGEPADEHRVNPRGIVRDFRGNHMRMVREQREGGIAVRTDSKGRSAPELLVTGCDLLIDGIGAARAYESGLLHAGSGGKRPAERPIADDTNLVADILREPEGRADDILASPDGGTRRGVECREDIGFADPQAVAARVSGLADIRLQV